MIKVTVQKNLIGMEDLLTGTSTVSQTRGPTGSTPVTITEINGAVFPYDATYTMKQKIDNLQSQMDTLPEVVDSNGILLTGLINTSTTDLNLVNRLWRKTIDANTAEIYYYNELLFQYDPTAGNLIVPDDYIAADAVVTSAFQAADTNLQNQITAFGTAADEDVGVLAGNVVQLDSSAKLPAIDGSQLTGINSSNVIPIGVVLYVTYTSLEADFLQCNGSAISRTTYSDLFTKIGTTFGTGDGSTTFNLPDLRGEFLRGFDDGRGIDSGRTLGSYQSDEQKAHTHDEGTLIAASNGAHTHDAGLNSYSSSGGSSLAAYFNGNSGEGNITTSSGGAHTHTLSGSTSSTGGSETRPRNIALNPIIKVL